MQEPQLRLEVPPNAVPIVQLPPHEKKGIVARVRKFGKGIIGKLDSYGGQIEGDPAFRKPTVVGAILSVGFKFLFLAMVAYAFYKLFFRGDMIINEGNIIILNPRTSSSTTCDFPPAVFQVDNKLHFFERNAPRVQRIEVVDKSQLTDVPHFTSNDEYDEDPKSSSVYKNLEVPINSYDTSTTYVWTDKGDMGTINMRDMINEQNSHHFLAESLKGIKSLLYSYDTYSQMFEHTISAFLRFKVDEISKLKKCQLQVAMVNYYEYMVINDLEDIDGLKNVSNHNRLTSMQSIDNLWAPDNFDENDGKIHDVYHTYMMKRDYTEDDLQLFFDRNEDVLPDDVTYDDALEDIDVNNWVLMVNYVNNFVSMAENRDICVDTPWFNREAAVAVKSSMTDTTMVVPAITNAQDVEFCSDLSVPFYVVAQNHVGQEIIEVKSVSGTCATDMTFTIKRPLVKLNFSLPKPTDFPDYPDNRWKCNPANYFNGGACDCNCGMFDPDCFASGLASDNCQSDEVCSFSGKCVSEHANWMDEDPSNADMIIISDRCSQIYPKGRQYYVGPLGIRPEDLEDCQLCPGEDIYDYLPKKSEISEEYVCNYHTKGYMDPLLQDPQRVFQGDGSLYINVTLFRGAPFPEFDEPIYDDLPVVLFDDEQAYLFESSPVQSGRQFLNIAGEKGLEPLLDKISYGFVYSSISTKSREFLMYIPGTEVAEIEKKYYFTFPETGFPYRISAEDGFQIEISSFESEFVPAARSIVQIGELSEYPDFDFGYRLTTKGGTIAKNTEVFNVTYSAQLDTIDEFILDLLPIRVLFQDAEPQKYEFAEIINIRLLTDWTCWLEFYFQRDGICDCECGIYDPDCAMPTPKKFADDYGWVDGCDGYDYCSYPDSECTNTKPTYDGPVESEDIIIEITLAAGGTQKGHQAGTVLHIIPVGWDVLEDNYEIDDLPALRKIVPVSLYKTAKEKEFSPSERFLAQSNEDFESPAKLNVETAMFLYPIHEDYVTVELCPLSRVNNSNKVSETFENWVIHEDMKLSVVCGVEGNGDELFEVYSKNECVLDASDIDDEDLVSICAVQMPTERTMMYNITVPISHRFDEALDKANVEERSDYVFESETYFDFESVISFSYDRSVEKTEETFAQNKESGGDRTYNSVTGSEEMRRYFGAFEYRGGGKGMDSEFNSSVPASIPYLFTDFRLKLHADYEELIPKTYYLWPRKGSASLEDAFGDLNDVSMYWDMGGETPEDADSTTQKIPIYPGLKITFYATIQLIPYYRNNYPISLVSGIPPLSSFPTIVKENLLSAYRVTIISQSMKKEYVENSDQAVIRYRISLDGKARQFKAVLDYTISSLLSDIGSAMALTGGGLVILKLWQNTCEKNVKYLDLRAAQERKRIEKEEKKKKKLMKKGNIRETPGRGVQVIQVTQAKTTQLM